MQSSVILGVCVLVSLVLKQCFHMFEKNTGWDLLLISITAGYAYYVIVISWKGLLLSNELESNKILRTGIVFSIVSIAMTLLYSVYWTLPAFMHDENRLQFGVFIFSGLCIIISYTISVWVFYARRDK